MGARIQPWTVNVNPSLLCLPVQAAALENNALLSLLFLWGTMGQSVFI